MGRNRKGLARCETHGCDRVPTGVGNRTRCPMCFNGYMIRYMATEKGKAARRRYYRRRVAGPRRDRRVETGMCVELWCRREAVPGATRCGPHLDPDCPPPPRETRTKRERGLCVEPWCRREAERGRTRCGPCYELHAPSDAAAAVLALGGTCRRCGGADDLRIVKLSPGRASKQEALARLVLGDVAAGRDPRSRAWVLCVWCDLTTDRVR